MEGAREDLLFLENIDKVRGRTRVSGVVEHNSLEIDDESGQQIRITGKNKTYFATTDKDGVYEITVSRPDVIRSSPYCSLVGRSMNGC